MQFKTIIVLSARHVETEKVAALDMGADDYLDKPFGLNELMARMRAAARRHQRAEPDRAGFEGIGGLMVDFGNRRVTMHGREVRLSPKEYAILECLCQHAGQIVTRRQLLIAGWQDPTSDPQNLRVYMTMLRQKLGEDAGDPRLIATETGVGYRLIVEE